MAILDLPDGWTDIEGADVRVKALMAAEVDQVEGVLGARDQRLHQLLALRGDREDAPVVLGVEMPVQHPSVRAQRRLEGADDPLVSPLGEIRDPDQRQLPDRLLFRGAHVTRSSPLPTIASPSSSTVGFITTQSRWTGT